MEYKWGEEFHIIVQFLSLCLPVRLPDQAPILMFLCLHQSMAFESPEAAALLNHSAASFKLASAPTPCSKK